MVAKEIWTVGHSNRPIEDFIGLLRSHQIEVLVDVRRFPGSRRYPHFNSEELSVSLIKAGIEYRHFPELGGRRTARRDSPNTAWENETFRGYADYMMTGEFRSGIERLTQLARDKRTALMCAEALWWQCHRALIADYLKVHGVRVRHILGEVKVEEHSFTSPARIIDGKLSYAAPATPLEFNFG